MWIIFSVLFIIVLLIGYLIYKKWSTSVISIPLGIWLIPPYSLAGRLTREVKAAYNTPVAGVSDACRLEFAKLNKFLIDVGRENLLSEVDVPKELNWGTLDFITYVDLKLINYLRQDTDFVYHIGCEFDFHNRCMNIRKGMNVTPEEYRIIVAEATYIELMKQSGKVKRIPTPYSLFYRDQTKIDKLSGWIKIFSKTIQLDTSIQTVSQLLGKNEVFKSLNKEDQYVIYIYAVLFTCWENVI